MNEQIGGSWDGGAVSQPKQPCFPWWKKPLIEAVAVFHVLLFHFVIAAKTDASTAAGCLKIALIQGLSVYLIAALFWRSGPHANPLTSLLALIGKGAPRLSFVTLLLYCLVQLGFAVLAGLTARYWCNETVTETSLGVPVITTTNGIAFFVETLLSFVSQTTALVLSVNYRKVEGLGFNNPALVGGLVHVVLVAIGLSVGTGGCVNPLRHFGVAVFTGFASNSWIYYLAHTLGAIIACLVFILVLKEKSKRVKKMH